MAENPPYMSSYGYISKILDKIKTAQTPGRVTRDFLSTSLGMKSSAARAFIPFAKRIGFLNQDGSPTQLYVQFRDTDKATSGAAIASAMRSGYAELFSRNEYAHKLGEKELKGLVIQATGLGSDNRVVLYVVRSFRELQKYADFEADLEGSQEDDSAADGEIPPPKGERAHGLSLAYTINIVLPKTDDVAVFNAIFKSLRDNLLHE